MKYLITLLTAICLLVSPVAYAEDPKPSPKVTEGFTVATVDSDTGNLVKIISVGGKVVVFKSITDAITAAKSLVENQHLSIIIVPIFIPKEVKYD